MESKRTEFIGELAEVLNGTTVVTRRPYFVETKSSKNITVSIYGQINNKGTFDLEVVLLSWGTLNADWGHISTYLRGKIGLAHKSVVEYESTFGQIQKGKLEVVCASIKGIEHGWYYLYIGK